MDDTNLNAVLNSGGNRQYWLKPVGRSKDPNKELLPEFVSDDQLEIHFTDPCPSSVNQGDIIIAWRPGKGKLLFVGERSPGGPWRTENPRLEAWVRENYPWTFKAKNLTPEHSKAWSSYALKPWGLKELFNAKNPGRTVNLGALQYGKTVLRIPQEFAEYLIVNILDCDRPPSRSAS